MTDPEHRGFRRSVRGATSTPGARPGLWAFPMTGVLLLGCTDPTIPAVPPLSLEPVAEGLAQPVDLAAPPSDATRLFVLEKPGRVRVIRDGALLSEPFLDLTAQTSSNGERGLLGLAFHPDYATNGHLYLNHTDLDGDTRLLRVTAESSDRGDPASVEVLLEVPQPYANHNGGQLAFGPDGYLYVALGDGGSGGDPEGNGQNRATLLGTLLRLDVDRGLPYGVPPDNPFAGDPSGADEIWAYGLRNPWRFSFDATTGDLFVADVGQNRAEEISVIPAGAGGLNLGWNVREGFECHGASTCASAGFTDPVYEYVHDEGCSVTGGRVYRGDALPGLRGRYLFGDFCQGWIRSFVHADGSARDLVDHSVHLGTVPQLASFGVDASGEIYVQSLAGSVHRIVGTY